MKNKKTRIKMEYAMQDLCLPKF